MTVCRTAYNPVQGRGHGGLKCAKMADFKVCLLRQYACMHVFKRLMVNYDTP